MIDLQQSRKVLETIVGNIGKVIVGKQKTVELIVLAMAGGGHVLIEDVPGVGKTSLACALARSVDCEFKRIQFTPDILPSDITGFSIYNSHTGEFEFRPGPVMSNFVLADEINRTSPKTQASLLEIMEEGSVTVDGKSHPLPQPFMVLATQNPIEYQGTYPLPEAEIDRFSIRVSLGYPETEDELLILYNAQLNPAANLSPVASADDVLRVQEAAASVHVSKEVGRYILKIVNATRSSGELALGASPRASITLFRMAQALALYKGREFVIPDDVKSLAPFALCHRVLLSREAKISGRKAPEIIDGILAGNAGSFFPSVTPMAARIKLVNLLGYFLLLALSLADAYLLNNRFGYTPLLFLLLLLPVDALCALHARRSVRCLSSPDFQESERGAPAEFPYAYQNSSHFLVCRLGITLRLTGPKGARCGKSKAVLNLAPGATEIRFSVAPRHIGVYQTQVKSVRAYGPLGIFSMRLPAARSAAAVVTPSRGTAAAAYGPDADSARGIEGNDRILDGGRSASGNYNGVREYEPGDPLRSIHWKLTAHNHKMMTRLFEEEEEGYATIAVDLRPVPGPAEQALCVQDQLCESAYQSVLDRVEQGAKVRLVFFEGDSLRTIRVQSEADLTEAAVSLAAAGPAFEALADAPDALPAGGEALMVSASLDTALARRMGELSDAGGSAMLLLVAPARFARQDFQADFDCLREHGVDYTITEAARTRRGRKERLQIDRVSGEGREQ